MSAYVESTPLKQNSTPNIGEQYLRRELYAAVDQLAGLDIDAGDKADTDQRLLDYLLLLRECLRQYIASDGAVSTPDIWPLLQINIDYFATHVNKNLSEVVWQKWRNKLQAASKFAGFQPNVWPAQAYFNQIIIDKKQIMTVLQENAPIANWQGGYLFNTDDGDYSLDIYDNAILGGLLCL